jgi:protoporphyrinogen oxidase
MPEPRIVILGGGPAGVGAAWRLRASGKAQVTLLERQGVVGGNAGSFEVAGLRVDYGSHRLHPATDPAILADIRALLGPDLLDRPRHGRIGLMGRWIHFPLKPVDLALRLPPTFGLGTVRDAALKPFRTVEADTFAAVLWKSLGPTICTHFYFPYAEKIWGRPPEALSGIQARRRVSAGSFGKLVRKVLSAVPGLKPPGAGRFWYPRRGFGQITEAYAEAARRAGADVRLGAEVTGLAPPAGEGRPWIVEGRQGDEPFRLEADYVWSTIPITLLARLVRGGLTEAVMRASAGIQYRAMLLVYLVLDQDQFTEYDAHYLPAADVSITRLSEPKNYSASAEPQGRTVLCAELPCDADDATWRKDDEALGRQVADDLARAGIPLARPPVEVHVRRLRQAYPIYLNGYEKPFGVLDQWASALPRLVNYGRQGLFAHDNTHHALAMAYAAVEALEPAGWNAARWEASRRVFETHVVED